MLTLLLAISALAATAQTAPRRATKATSAAKATAVPAAASDAATPAAADGSFGDGAPASSANNGQGQGVYAAPGMPVNIKSGKEVEPYNSTNEKPGDKPRKGTTLSPK
ncbi:hypothetical protein EAH73_13445 [Hymenobacter nivis]|uniref:Uncharacterized protein n=1 Tax=Hymenobacter nivis TaxID=1850093 RepID=A0A502GW61_9BACT|nr:hypothetical protein EAH73_13445 [Hymenobacter nivis]